MLQYLLNIGSLLPHDIYICNINLRCYSCSLFNYERTTHAFRIKHIDEYGNCVSIISEETKFNYSYDGINHSQMAWDYYNELDKIFYDDKSFRGIHIDGLTLETPNGRNCTFVSSFDLEEHSNSDNSIRFIAGLYRDYSDKYNDDYNINPYFEDRVEETL